MGDRYSEVTLYVVQSIEISQMQKSPLKKFYNIKILRYKVLLVILWALTIVYTRPLQTETY